MSDFYYLDELTVLLSFDPNTFQRVCGFIISLFARYLHAKALSSLGNNYSPCYDVRAPHTVTSTGPYRFVRHPVYSSSLLGAFGCIVTSGSLWVVILFVIGLVWIGNSARREEHELVERFPEYKTYQVKTSRFIPFIY